MTPLQAPLEGIRAVLFDMAGTTVDEGAGGGSLVVEVFRQALANQGVHVTEAQIRQQRGRDKKEAIRRLLGPGAAVEPVYEDFLARLDGAVGRMREKAGAGALFDRLRAGGIAVGIGSGFPQTVVERLVRQLDWEGRVDYIGSAEVVGAGRPDPAMVRVFMRSCGVQDARAVLKVGDTAADIAEGKNAGVWTVGVLGGAQGRAELAGADYIVDGVAQVGPLLAL